MRTGHSRTLTAAAAALAAAAAALAADAAAQDTGDGKAAPGRGAPPAGLALRLSVKTPRVLPGAPVDLALVLANETKDVTIPVVKPGDGTDAGWREPWMSWDAFRVAADGTETRIERRPVLRCGNYDADWLKDVVRLAPGGTIDVASGPPALDWIYDFQQAGKVRLRATYRYSAGESARDPKKRPDGTLDTGGMGTTAAYELASNPVEFMVERPVDVVVTVRRAAKAGVATRPEDILEAVAAGAGGAEIRIAGGEWTLTWEMESSTATPDGWDETWLEPAPAGKRTETGTRVPLTGPASPVRRVSHPWTFDRPGTFRVAARLASAAERGARIRSAVVEVPVVK